MAKSKKVILFVVEGITDKTALDSILTNLLNNEKVHFAITDGDITTKKSVSSTNVISQLNSVIKSTLQKQAFKPTDLLEIIHLIDTDGAFIPDNAILCNSNSNNIEYTETNILSSNVNSIRERNQKKIAFGKHSA